MLATVYQLFPHMRTRSALHFAAALGKVDCVRLLLEAGADPNLQDKEGAWRGPGGQGLHAAIPPTLRAVLACARLIAVVDHAL